MTATQITHNDAPGTTLITHYEAEKRQNVLEAFQDGDFEKILKGRLGELVELKPGEPPDLFEEIFAWSAPRPPEFETAGLILTVLPGQFAAYKEWLADEDTLGELVTIWNRNVIYRHDVLALNGESLVAFYECASAYNVLKAFREPEALAMLLGELSSLLTLSAYSPMNLFIEIGSWRSGG